MSDNTVNGTSSVVRMRILLNCHLPLLPLVHDRLKLTMIPLSDDYDLERASGNSLQERSYLFNSFEALLSDEGEEGNHTKIPMPRPILNEEEL